MPYLINDPQQEEKKALRQRLVEGEISGIANYALEPFIKALDDSATTAPTKATTWLIMGDRVRLSGHTAGRQTQRWIRRGDTALI